MRDLRGAGGWKQRTGPAQGGAGMVEVELTEGAGGSSRRDANLTD